jgi:FKBP-type peptidyl-prolyl cis-trans isomerase
VESHPSIIVTDIKYGPGPIIQEKDRVGIIYKIALSIEQLEKGDLIDGDTTGTDVLIVDVLRDRLIPGVYETLLGMQTGGAVRRAIIPPNLAFGEYKWQNVPASSTLYLEILSQHIILEAID